MEYLLSVEMISALLTLAALEIVLGIDNVVFIAILSGKLPPDKQAAARRLGLALAALGRIVLLLLISLVVTLDKHELFGFALFGHELSFTGKDLILVGGGLFLLAKATWEIHHSLEGVTKHGGEESSGGGTASFGAVIAQVLALDLVFSIDSVLTAIGMVDPSPDQYPGAAAVLGVPWPPLVVMVTAVVLAIAVMLIFVGPISRFIKRHPTMKMLALSFLLLIGLVLVAEGLGAHIPRGYIYFGMGFSLFVELLNLKLIAKKTKPAPPRDRGPQHPVPEGSVDV